MLKLISKTFLKRFKWFYIVFLGDVVVLFLKKLHFVRVNFFKNENEYTAWGDNLKLSDKVKFVKKNDYTHWEDNLRL